MLSLMRVEPPNKMFQSRTVIGLGHNDDRGHADNNPQHHQKRPLLGCQQVFVGDFERI